MVYTYLAKLSPGQKMWFIVSIAAVLLITRRAEFHGLARGYLLTYMVAASIVQGKVIDMVERRRQI